MQMTQPIEEAIDKYELFLDLYGRKRYKSEMKRSCEKAEKNGEQKGRLKEKEVIVLNMLKDNFHLEVIVRITGLSKEDITQLAQDNNLTISPR